MNNDANNQGTPLEQQQLQPQEPAQQNFMPNPTPQQQKSSALPIWALILSILGIVTGIVVFLSIPLALVALILGIVALKKRATRKGMSIASIVISAFTLVVIVPIMLFITLVAFNGVTDVANRAVVAAENRAAGDRFVDTPCFTFTAPTGYDISDLASSCAVILTDTSTRDTQTSSPTEGFIVITPINEDVSNENRVFAYLESAYENIFDAETAEVLDTNGYTVYSYKSNDEPNYRSYIVIDESGIHNQDGVVTGYELVAEIDTPARTKDLMQAVQTFIIKTETQQ
jgi:hypothetical protein